MPDQIGYFASLKNAAGKVFSYLASITLTGTDGKTITVTQDTSLDEAVAMSGKAPKASPTFTGTVTMPAFPTKTPPIDADKVPYRDSVASDAIVTSTWAQIKAFLKTYFDTLYNLYVHPNHSGEVTSVADGAQTIAVDAVTYAKMQNVSATDKLLGRSTAGAGDVEEIICTAAGRAILDDVDAAAQRATLSVQPTASPVFTGVVEAPTVNLTGGQIAFPAAQAASANANTLDDYEEGTWTPVIAFGGAAVGVTYGVQVGAYVKIGKVVFFTCRLVLSSNGTSVGAATIGGLPFTPDAINYLRCLAAARVGVTLTREMYGKINVNDATIYLITTSGNESSLTEVEISDTADIFVIGYFYI